MTPPVKPRVHWVSPLPPAQTDIAHYTRRILPELAAETDLVLWTDAPRWDRELHDIAPVRRLDPDRVTPRDFAQAARPDGKPGQGPEVVMVNIGNAWPFHAGFLRMVQRIPSVIVLHDMAIQEMCHDAMDRDLLSRDLYEELMAQWHGQKGRDAVHATWKQEMTPGELSHRYPGFELALTRAVSVLTHTPVARDAVNATQTMPTYLLDLPFRPSAAEPAVIRSGIGPMRLVQFGYTGPNRRLQNVLEALAGLKGEVDFYLDVMGKLWDPAYIAGRIRDLGLTHHVSLHGFVQEAELDAKLAAAHLVFNLRNPTMGEASGSQMRIWNAAAPSVVTDLGWYAALPDDTVFKIDPTDEVPALQALIRQLAEDPAPGRAKGAAGRARLQAAHTPARYARGVAAVAAQFSADAARATRQGAAHPGLKT